MRGMQRILKIESGRPEAKRRGNKRKASSRHSSSGSSSSSNTNNSSRLGGTVPLPRAGQAIHHQHRQEHRQVGGTIGKGHRHESIRTLGHLLVGDTLQLGPVAHTLEGPRPQIGDGLGGLHSSRHRAGDPATPRASRQIRATRLVRRPRAARRTNPTLLPPPQRAIASPATATETEKGAAEVMAVVAMQWKRQKVTSQVTRSWKAGS
mmetsp:Transcript_101174/g.262010  ORF Transcript_101174/g.262010 Transcript_101174/m.262010 type:complete len:207 (-) Transcript_101174:1453-2073(-)